MEKLKAEVEQLKCTVARLEEEQSAMAAALFSREDFQRNLRSLIAAEVASASGTDARVAMVPTTTGMDAELQSSFQPGT